MDDISDKLSYRLLSVEKTALLNIMLNAMSLMEQYNGRSIEECIMLEIGIKTKEQLNKEYA